MLLKTSRDPAVEKVRQLGLLKGIGVNYAWLCVMAFFGWPSSRTPKSRSACVLYADAAPERRGGRERGIDKAGTGMRARWRSRSRGVTPVSARRPQPMV